MNNHLPPIYPNRNRVATVQGKKANPVETFQDMEDKDETQPRPFVERRRNQDRRSSRATKRSIYDMRASKGRRRTDRNGHAPFIVTEA